MCKTFEIGLVRAIDVEMVGIDSRNHRHVRCQVMERAVELVSLDNHQIARIGEHQITRIVFGDTAQKGVAIDMALFEQMREHGRCGGFAVRAGHTQAAFHTRDFAQHLRPFFDGEAMLPKIDKFAVFGRDGGCIDHQSRFVVQKFGSDLRHIVSVVNGNAFGFELLAQATARAVVTGHSITFRRKIARNGTHADAADSEKIDVFIIHSLVIIYSFDTISNVYKCAKTSKQEPQSQVCRECRQQAYVHAKNRQP